MKNVNLIGKLKLRLKPLLSTTGNTWENCVVELEQTGTPGEVDFGTLSVFGSKKNKVINYTRNFCFEYTQFINH